MKDDRALINQIKSLPVLGFQNADMCRAPSLEHGDDYVPPRRETQPTKF